MTDFELVPLSRTTANNYIAEHHRHHGRVHGFKFAIGLELDNQLVGVAVAGRPVARMLDDGRTLEVTRLATDGTPNACSALYSAVRRAAKPLGYLRLITYILDSEDGTSLKASGWKLAAPSCGGGGWDRPNRARVDKAPTVAKQRWEATL